MRTITRRVLMIALAGMIPACAADSDSNAGPTNTPDPVDPAAAAAKSDLRVDLALSQAAYAADEAVIANVTVTNTGASKIKLLSWMLPSADLEESVFVVTEGGQRAAFLGAHFKRAGMAAGDFEYLAPGASITRQVDLSHFYDLSRTGDYQIRIAIDEGELRPDDGGAAAVVTSNTARAWIEARAARQGEPVAISSSINTLAGSLSFSRCTTSQADLVAQAAGVANSYSDGALAYLSGTPTASQRYTTWFGAFSSTGWNTAKTHFAAIADAFDTKAITVDCGCRKKYYAYVYPTQPYTIYVCSVFWQAPLSGTDSKGGTLIHEMSHFNVVAATDDWAYGQSAAKSLAISDPSKALSNADSHEYFAENTPALP